MDNRYGYLISGHVCNLCGGIFDFENVCNVGKHEKGSFYRIPPVVASVVAVVSKNKNNHKK